MTEQPAPTPPDALARFVGACLMAVGGLMAILSGLCSAAFLSWPLMEGFKGSWGHAGELLSFIAMVAIVGGIPFAAGLGLLYLGRKIRQVPKT